MTTIESLKAKLILYENYKNNVEKKLEEQIAKINRHFQRSGFPLILPAEDFILKEIRNELEKLLRPF